MIGAFVLINAEGDRIAELGRELAALEGVTGAYSVAGDVDLVVVLRVAEPEQVAAIVTGRIAKLQGVRDTRTLIAFRAYSGDDIAAAYEGMED
jgi:DNA-binding Lrp family transcriptional regulator